MHWKFLGNLSKIFVLIVFKTETSAKMLERYGQLNSNTSNEANSAPVPHSEKVKKFSTSFMSLALNGTVNMLHLHNLCTLTSNVVQGKDIDPGVEIFF